MNAIIDVSQLRPPEGFGRGKRVIVEEEPIIDFPGYSGYRLPGGDRLVILETVTSLPSVGWLLVGLWRAIADLTSVCPCCGSRARFAAAEPKEPHHPDILMEHEAGCPLGDGMLAANRDVLDSVGPGTMIDLPPAPRAWIVRAPKLRRASRGADTTPSKEEPPL